MTSSSILAATWTWRKSHLPEHAAEQNTSTMQPFTWSLRAHYCKCNFLSFTFAFGALHILALCQLNELRWHKNCIFQVHCYKKSGQQKLAKANSWVWSHWIIENKLIFSFSSLVLWVYIFLRKKPNWYICFGFILLKFVFNLSQLVCYLKQCKVNSMSIV